MPHDHYSLIVADSFRVRCEPESGLAEVRAFESHLERFRDGVTESLEQYSNEDWWEGVFEPFMESVPDQIQFGGAGFPRLELWAGEHRDELALRVRIRECPRLGGRLGMRTAPGFELSMPWIKGPNLTRLVELNRTLEAEALLIDGQGCAVEGATTSVIWWRDGVMHITSSQARVSSVTESLLIGIAENLGIEVRTGTQTPEQLAETEVWAVNALHGVRVVSTIDDRPLPGPNSRRIARFRDALEDTWQPVLGEAIDDETNSDFPY